VDFFLFAICTSSFCFSCLKVIDVYSVGSEAETSFSFASSNETRISVEHSFRHVSNASTKVSRVLFVGHKDASLFPSKQEVGEVRMGTS